MSGIILSAVNGSGEEASLGRLNQWGFVFSGVGVVMLAKHDRSIYRWGHNEEIKKDCQYAKFAWLLRKEVKNGC